MKKYYLLDFDKQRKALMQSEAVKPLIDALLNDAEAALSKTYEALKMSDYMLFLETGDRTKFERYYFERRRDCSYISIAYWLTEDEKYVEPLIDLVYMICDEFTWCLPAHSGLDEKPTIKKIQTQIDLFQAETTRLLTDIDAMVGDKLPYYVSARIRSEIRWRIIDTLGTREFYWHMGCDNNWAAVCAGGTAVGLLHYGTEEEINTHLPKLYGAMESFLGGFNDDGCCLEGYSYWRFGFGYFVIFARMILDYTNGEVNYFKREKVKNIALFPQKVRMGTGRVASFSDGESLFDFAPGLMCYLKELYPDEFLLPEIEYGKAKVNVYPAREFLWLSADYKEDEFKEHTTFFDGAQWFSVKNKNFSFAAKAGYNSEPHNHNDVGSFLIVTNDNDVPLADFGCGLYDAKNFHPDYRYTLITNSSAGHSVPIINGENQKFGSEYRASNVVCEGNKFSFDFEGAYEKGIINKLHREFIVNENGIVVCDTAEFSQNTQSITERMVSWTKPQICDGFVDLKTAKIIFDKDMYNVSFKEDSYVKHGDSGTALVYLIDFEPKNSKTREFSFEIVVK